jgi:predicted RNA-binding protein with RPS1 domain
MTHNGEGLRGRVVQIEQFGIYVKTSVGLVLILAPDVIASRRSNLNATFNLGEEVEVSLRHFVDAEGHYMGVMPDPVRDARTSKWVGHLIPRGRIRGVVISVSRQGMTVDTDEGPAIVNREDALLPDGSPLTRHYRVGEELQVALIDYNASTGEFRASMRATLDTDSA